MKKNQRYECVFSRKNNVLNYIVILTLCVMLVFSLQPTISNIMLINTQINYSKYLRMLEEKKDKEGFNSLYSINPDLLAWIKIEDIDLSVPIVKTNIKQDEDFYLNHGFDKKENSLGCPYQAYNYDLYSNHTLFIGHSSYTMSVFGNTSNVSLFGKLNDYTIKKANYNYNLTLQTDKTTYFYKIIGVFYFKITNTNSMEYKEILNNVYSVTNFNNQSDLDNYISCIEKYSILDKEINATLDDQFLTLFTCYYDLDYRTMVIAQKVNNI